MEKLDQEFVRSVFEVSNRVFMTGPVDFIESIVVPLCFGLDVLFEIVVTSNIPKKFPMFGPDG